MSCRGKHPTPGLQGGRWRRQGSAALRLLFWLIALVVMVVPFLRAPDGPTEDGKDWRRQENLAAAEEDDSIRADLTVPERIERLQEELGEYLEGEIAPPLDEARRQWFELDSEPLRESGLLDLARIPSGRQVFLQQCAGCHGTQGDGAGPAARHLFPRPRNFRLGIFKFTSTGTGQRPLRKDLLATVTNGLAGAAMPDFRLLPRELRLDVVEYVRFLAMQGEFEQTALDLIEAEEELPDFEEVADIVQRAWDPDELRGVYPTVPEPDRDQASVDRGRALFLDATRGNCAGCHGQGGRGDGPSAGDFHDGWGYPIQPRDFTAGVFRAGTEPANLWVTISTGINGTPMGAFGGVFSGEEIWDLVHFVQSLAAGPSEEGN